MVAFLYVMLLLGMVISALAFGSALADFSQLRLIQVIQSAAVVTLVLNVVALWKQEVRRPELTAADRPRRPFREAWGELVADRTARRLLLALGLGTAAFSMQDILLEPYGGEILGLSVSSTTFLTAMWACGALTGFALAARWLATFDLPPRSSPAFLPQGIQHHLRRKKAGITRPNPFVLDDGSKQPDRSGLNQIAHTRFPFSMSQ